MATASGVDWCLHCEENSLGRSATGWPFYCPLSSPAPAGANVVRECRHAVQETNRCPTRRGRVVHLPAVAACNAALRFASAHNASQCVATSAASCLLAATGPPASRCQPHRGSSCCCLSRARLANSPHPRRSPTIDHRPSRKRLWVRGARSRPTHLRFFPKENLRILPQKFCVRGVRLALSACWALRCYGGLI